MSSKSSPVGPTPMEVRDDSKLPSHHLALNGDDDVGNSRAPSEGEQELQAHGKRMEAAASASTRPEEVELDVHKASKKQGEQVNDRFYVGGYAVGGSKENRERLAKLDSPLMRAVGNADADAMEELFKKDPHQIFQTYDWGWSISHFAAATGMYEILEWTSERRETKELLTRVNDCGLTPMHYAAANGQYDALEFLVRTVPDCIFAECNDGRKPIDIARKGKCKKLLTDTLAKSVLRRKASPEGLKLHTRKGEERTKIPPLTDPDDRVASSAGCSCCLWRRK